MMKKSVMWGVSVAGCLGAGLLFSGGCSSDGGMPEGDGAAEASGGSDSVAGSTGGSGGTGVGGVQLPDEETGKLHEGLADCETDGQKTPSGSVESRARYEAAEVSFGQGCQSEEQTRSCTDGAWSEWTGEFAEEECSVSAAAACDGQPHGATEVRTRYEASSVPFGQSCRDEVQTRSCTDGAWSAWTGEFGQGECTIAVARACDGRPHGTTDLRTRYAVASVAFGETCPEEVQERTCGDGAWSSWSGSYEIASCTVSGAASCGATPHGGTDSRVRYQANSVPYGSTCQLQTQNRSCHNGTWSGWSGTFTAENCSVARPSSCDGSAHGTFQTRVRFQSASIPWSSSCRPEWQVSTCNNGEWSAWSGTYVEESCTREAPRSCDGSGHLTTQRRERFEKAVVLVGESCESEPQSRTCRDGTWTAWSGTYPFSACTIDASNDPFKGIAQACHSVAHCAPGLQCRWDLVNYRVHRQCTAECTNDNACTQQYGANTQCLSNGRCAASCDQDADCPAQSVCNTEGWCQRGGPGTGNPYCGGQTNECLEQVDAAACESIKGCKIFPNAQECILLPGWTCGSNSDNVSCYVDGCDWIDWKCVEPTVPRCTGRSHSACKNLTFCALRPHFLCFGSEVECRKFPVNRCTEQPGCEAKPGD